MTLEKKKQIWDAMTKYERSLIAGELLIEKDSSSIADEVFAQMDIKDFFFKLDKWYNFGDANPREHGGIFVKRTATEIEVVSTDFLEGLHGIGGYQFNQRSEYADELIAEFIKFKSCEGKSGVGRCMDWGRFVQLEKEGWPIDRILMYLAADMISYYGSSCEIDSDTNYWGYLKRHGITPKNWV